MTGKKESPFTVVQDLRPAETPELVASLEELVRLAKKGELRGFAAVYEYADGGCASECMYEDGCHPSRLIGEVAYLQDSMIHQLRDYRGTRSRE